MPRTTYPRDSFDDATAADRVGAHRAEQPRMRTGTLFAWAAAATVVLIALGVFGTLLATGRIAIGPPAATHTATPAPTVTPVVDTSYLVLVLNATGQDGEATLATDVIVRAGWPADNVSPGEAGSTYPTTTVYYVHPEDEAAAAGLANVVGAAAVVQSDRYQAADPAAKQLTVVLGTDRVEQPAPADTP